MSIELIVTRHAALVNYLLEIGLADSSTEVVSHATAEAVAGKNVAGVLPHSLSVLTASYTEVPLALPAELRGQELSLEQVRQFAGKPVTYRVRPDGLCPFCGSDNVVELVVPCDNPYCEQRFRSCRDCGRREFI